MNSVVSCSAFTQFLVDQLPVYDKLILQDIRPTDGWIGHVSTGTFEAYSGVEHTRDRFNHVYPDVTQQWNAVSASSCVGTPCDKTENCIGWGSTRVTHGLKEQSWSTPLLCFDQLMHITKAREQFRQIISDILKPATSAIMSGFLRKYGASLVDNKFIANSTFGTTASNFTFTWVAIGTQEIYIDTNAPPTSVFKLTPQMLARMVEPLMRVGYMGKMPFAEKRPPLLELVTDLQTCWELDRLGGTNATGFGNGPTVSGNWRFQQWDAGNKFWAYGFSGQIGNYATRVDPFALRFNYTGIVNGLYRYQVVLPYKNVASSGAGGEAGIKSINNSDYDNAQFGFSYIWHPQIMQALVADATPVNPEMPFSPRNFGGKWQFVMDNLGADADGCVIENKRRNKGQFIADFKIDPAPMYTELGCLIFHKREPSCIVEIDTCNADPGYPDQVYESCNSSCAQLA